jgi:flagellar basal body-associated protein FliL
VKRVQMVVGVLSATATGIILLSAGIIIAVAAATLTFFGVVWTWATVGRVRYWRPRGGRNSEQCPNCHASTAVTLPVAVHGYTEHLDFVTSNGFNPVNPTVEQFKEMTAASEVDLLSTDPVEASITYSLDDDYLRTVLDEELNVIDVSRCPESAPD